MMVSLARPKRFTDEEREEARGRARENGTASNFSPLIQHPPLEYPDEEWLSYPALSSQYYLPGNTRKKLTAGICRASPATVRFILIAPRA